MQGMQPFQTNIFVLVIKPIRCADFSYFIFGIKLYMFRKVPLSIIRSFIPKIKYEKLVHLIGFIIRI
jgi:hypothetical protein